MVPNYPGTELVGAEFKTENEKFAVMCSRSPQNLKFSHFTFLFCQGRRRNAPKFITLVQGIALLTKSYCFMAFPSPSPSPSYLLKLPNTDNGHCFCDPSDLPSYKVHLAFTDTWLSPGLSAYCINCLMFRPSG